MKRLSIPIQSMSHVCMVYCGLLLLYNNCGCKLRFKSSTGNILTYVGW